MASATTFSDRYSLPLSTHSEAAAVAYGEGVDHLLALTAGGEERLRAAVDADVGFALAYAALALVLQMQGKPADATETAEHARSLAEGTTELERRHVEAVAAVVGGEIQRAGGLIREQLAVFPRDALLLRQAIFTISFSGVIQPKEEMLALLERVAPAYGDDWYFLSQYAMALQDLNRLEEARRIAERSLDQHPRSASSVHPVAHVFYESNDHAAGTAFLDGWMTDYEPYAPYYTHLSWHLALFELAQGRYRRVMELYDRAIQPSAASVRSVMFDAPSLLWRCELYGAAGLDLPWKPVRDVIDRLVARHGQIFPDSHAALTYAAMRDEAALGRMVNALRVLDMNGHPTAGSVGLPLVHGLAAFARGDYEEAVRRFDPIKDQLVRIGGSHAQNEVFEDTLIESYLRAGRYDEAEVWLRRRLDRRPSARDYFWLGRAQAARDDRRAAAESLASARSHWSTADEDSPEVMALDALLGDSQSVTAQ
jgi:tetratricopeptide (TPR) repeat protein